MIDEIAILQEVLNGEEHRIFVVDGEIKVMYKKEKSQIIGDGIKTVNQLVFELNNHLPKTLQINYESVKILKKGEKLIVSQKSSIGISDQKLELVKPSEEIKVS